MESGGMINDQRQNNGYFFSGCPVKKHTPVFRSVLNIGHDYCDISSLFYLLLIFSGMASQGGQDPSVHVKDISVDEVGSL